MDRFLGSLVSSESRRRASRQNPRLPARGGVPKAPGRVGATVIRWCEGRGGRQLQGSRFRWWPGMPQRSAMPEVAPGVPVGSLDYCATERAGGAPGQHTRLSQAGRGTKRKFKRKTSIKTISYINKQRALREDGRPRGSPLRRHRQSVENNALSTGCVEPPVVTGPRGRRTVVAFQVPVSVAAAWSTVIDARSTAGAWEPSIHSASEGAIASCSSNAK